MSNKKLNVALAIVALGTWGLAHAQVSYVRPTYIYPAEPPVSGPASAQIPGSPFYIAPYLAAGFGHDDNLFLSHTNKTDSDFYLFSPGFRIDGRDANKVVQLSYQAQVGRYTSSSADNYVDQTARAQFDTAFNPHNFLRVGYDYLIGHDPRGATDRPVEGRPDTYHVTYPYLTYALGAPGAQGRVEVYYSNADRRYTNNRSTTFASDHYDEQYGAAFYWRVQPKTYLLVEARQDGIRYRQPGSIFSADETRYYGGVTWEATAKTTGTLKVGELRRDFQSSSIPSYTGTSWEGLVTWSPRTYSKFDFYTSRQTNESTGLGDFILTSIAGVAWTHHWSSQWLTSVDTRYQKDDYKGFDRSDRTEILALRAGYRFSRWLTLSAEYDRTQRDSNIDTFEYDKNLFLLSISASM